MRLDRWLVMSVFVVLATLASSPAASEGFRCEPTEVREAGNRIHVRCAEPAEIRVRGSRVDILFFAIDKSDAERATRYASMATTAMTCGLAFWVDFDPAAAVPTNVANCQPHDCRTPGAFAIRR